MDYNSGGSDNYPYSDEVSNHDMSVQDGDTVTPGVNFAAERDIINEQNQLYFESLLIDAQKEQEKQEKIEKEKKEIEEKKRLEHALSEEKKIKAKELEKKKERLLRHLVLDKSKDTIELAIKVPSGKKFIRNFLLEGKQKLIYDWVDVILAECEGSEKCIKDYNITTQPLDGKNYKIVNRSKNIIKDLGLIDKTMLLLKLGKNHRITS